MSEVESIKESFTTMSMYYYQSLKDLSIPNPSSIILKDLLSFLPDKDPEVYKLVSPNSAINPNKIIEDVNVLLDVMDKTNKVNKADLVLIKQNLHALKQCIIKT